MVLSDIHRPKVMSHKICGDVTYFLRSQRGEGCAALPLLVKKCRCLTSILTTRTWSLVGTNTSCHTKGEERQCLDKGHHYYQQPHTVSYLKDQIFLIFHTYVKALSEHKKLTKNKVILKIHITDH